MVTLITLTKTNDKPITINADKIRIIEQYDHNQYVDIILFNNPVNCNEMITVKESINEIKHKIKGK